MLFRKHIPRQQEIDALLKNLHKRKLHNLMVNLDTKDLIESYTKSLRYREIYNYIADGRLPGNAITQKKIVGEAANYIVVVIFPICFQKYKSILKRVPYAKEQSLKIQNNDHITAIYQ